MAPALPACFCCCPQPHRPSPRSAPLLQLSLLRMGLAPLSPGTGGRASACETPAFGQMWALAGRCPCPAVGTGWYPEPTVCLRLSSPSRKSLQTHPRPPHSSGGSRIRSGSWLLPTSSCLQGGWGREGVGKAGCRGMTSMGKCGEEQLFGDLQELEVKPLAWAAPEWSPWRLGPATPWLFHQENLLSNGKISLPPQQPPPGPKPPLQGGEVSLDSPWLFAAGQLCPWWLEGLRKSERVGGRSHREGPVTPSAEPP